MLKKISAHRAEILIWRRHPDLNRGIEVLQTYALPLGYVAKMPEHIRHFDLWLGYKDSNLGIPESESGALPLGDTPTAL